MEKFICIHGHFYQPPRENPWLEAIETQDLAYPYHDWNERITAECYEPNTAARILGPKDRIVEIVNNYSNISFNFGPTLLSWMENKAPEVYQAVLDADRISQDKFSGHGSAIAQVYNHIIMPLANRRDQETQVIWGIQDFARRFRRQPEGMWLAETAVDVDTLEVLAGQGIAFTILAAHQAKRIRKQGESKWTDVNGGQVDPRRPYQCLLPSGKSITLFFYDNPVAHEVAFGPLLKNGEQFARRLAGLFGEDGGNPAQLVHIATDGETYGHHHRYGDMALAYCLDFIASHQSARITVYGEYLEKYPPADEVEIVENTSWSCFHGLERWRSDCGCNSGLRPGSTQAWRAPLREALDALRDDLVPVYEKQMLGFAEDPWQVRNDYINVILDRSEGNVRSFLRSYCPRAVSDDDQVKALKLLELQRHALLMYTSCGWFFDEISGIETVQVMQYAARAMQLAQEIAGVDLRKYFVDHLAAAPSNEKAYGDGRQVWLSCVEPAVTDLLKISAQYAVDTVFSPENGREPNQFCYDAAAETFSVEELGGQKLVTGRMRVCSLITRETSRVLFGLLHLGEHNLVVGIRRETGDNSFAQLHDKASETFLHGDMPETIRLLDDYFSPNTYTFNHLFKDKQRTILKLIMQSAMDEAESYFRRIYEHHYPLIQVMNKLKLPLPKILSTAVEFILNTDITRQLESDPPQVEELLKLVAEMNNWKFKRDKTMLQYVASQAVTRLVTQFSRQPGDLELLNRAEKVLAALRLLQLDLDIWKAQNVYHALDKELYLGMQERAEGHDQIARKWLELFASLGNALRVDHATEEPGQNHHK
ncbi:DUF3536 domain-containing protein [candidate division FCPU426 bacterium]|nr:DUF3536 domain-containing protein [candidate division FCPU426 bacterium]